MLRSSLYVVPFCVILSPLQTFQLTVIKLIFLLLYKLRIHLNFKWFLDTYWIKFQLFTSTYLFYLIFVNFPVCILCFYQINSPYTRKKLISSLSESQFGYDHFRGTEVVETTL